VRLPHPIDLGRTDALARADTPVHRLDPRAMVLATAAFAVVVVSFPATSVSALLPLAAFPLAVATAARVPPDFLLRRMLIAAPFAVMVGLFNPLIDHRVVMTLGGVPVTSGWLSFASILVRFALTVAAALVLVAVTGIHRLCSGLERLGLPRVVTVQVLFLYRYLFVVADEGLRMARAVALRSGARRRPGPRVVASLLGSLLLRSVERAQRVHQAMVARGFDGTVRTLRRERWGRWDTAFLAGWLGFFVLARSVDLAALAGALLLGGTR
jgi:cobalt/nickel transport system permease protein